MFRVIPCTDASWVSKITHARKMTRAKTVDTLSSSNASCAVNVSAFSSPVLKMVCWIWSWRSSGSYMTSLFTAISFLHHQIVPTILLRHQKKQKPSGQPSKCKWLPVTGTVTGAVIIMLCVNLRGVRFFLLQRHLHVAHPLVSFHPETKVFDDGKFCTYFH